MISKEDRETAHRLLDKLMDDPDGDTIMWERLWFNDDEEFWQRRRPHRTRYLITMKIEQTE